MAELKSAILRPEDVYAGLPRRRPEDLAELAREQGSSLALRVEDVVVPTWAEGDPTADEIIQEMRATRRDDPTSGNAWER